MLNSIASPLNSLCGLVSSSETCQELLYSGFSGDLAVCVILPLVMTPLMLKANQQFKKFWATQAAQAAAAAINAIPISLSIKEMDGSNASITLSQGSTIQALKKQLASQQETIPQCLGLHFKGKEEPLGDEQTLIGIGLVEGAELYLLKYQVTERDVLMNIFVNCGGGSCRRKDGWGPASQLASGLV